MLSPNSLMPGKASQRRTKEIQRRRHNARLSEAPDSGQPNGCRRTPSETKQADSLDVETSLGVPVEVLDLIEGRY